MDSSSSTPTRTAITTVEESATEATSLSAPSSPKTQFLSLPAFESSVSSITRSDNKEFNFEQELITITPEDHVPTVTYPIVNTTPTHSIDLSAVSYDPSTRDIRSARSTNAMLAALDDLGADATSPSTSDSTPSIELSAVTFDPSTREIRSIKSTGAMLAALEDEFKFPRLSSIREEGGKGGTQ